MIKRPSAGYELGATLFRAGLPFLCLMDTARSFDVIPLPLLFAPRLNQSRQFVLVFYPKVRGAHDFRRYP